MEKTKFQLDKLGRHTTLHIQFYSAAECVNNRTPIYIDGWMNSHSFACILCESPFSLDSTWKIIWEQDVVLIVTLLTSVAKVGAG